MTIGRFLSVSISLLALIACALGAMVALEKWAAMQATSIASVRLDALQAMADIPATINSERGLYALQMPVVAPGDSSQQGTIADGVRLSDAAFAKAKAKVGMLFGRVPEADDLIAGVDKAIANWLDARKLAEQVLAQTPIDQRGDMPQMLVDQNARTNAAVAVLMRDELRRLARVSGNAYRYADIANSVTELRDIGGRQFGVLINATGSKKPVSVETRTGITLLEGQIQLIGIHLSALSDIPGLPDALKVALQNVKTVYFGDIASDKKRIIPALETGEYPFEASELRAKSMAAWKKVLELRDAAYAAAEDQSSAENTEESRSFLISVGASLLALALSIAIGVLVRMRVTAPLAQITGNMGRIAGGELTLAIDGLDRSDEVGGMARALQVFKDGLIRNRDLEAEAAQDRDAVESRRKATLSDLAATFETTVGAIVGAVATSSREMESAARSMSQTAVETSNRSTAVAAAAEEASTNVSAVASSTEELGSSVQEISRQVQQSSQMSQAAVSEASETAMIVKELSLAASKISDVVSLISSIAGQTNLLALNATIEAARAGEAGRGFAIVAAEVKELANQTAKATSEISDQISAIQNSTGRAVGAIDGIGRTIKSMNDVAAAISESVAQQGAATNEIVRTIEQASIGTGEVTDNISRVAHAAHEAGSAAQQVLSSSGLLSKQSDDLRVEVDKFLKKVRSA